MLLRAYGLSAEQAAFYRAAVGSQGCNNAFLSLSMFARFPFALKERRDNDLPNPPIAEAVSCFYCGRTAGKFDVSGVDAAGTYYKV